jgi:cell division protein FtsQ
MWNKIIHIGGWSGGVVLLFVLLGASISSSNRSHLADVKVHIDFGEGNYFIDKEEVEEVVSDLGYIKDSTLLAEIVPSRIEHVLENNPFIKDAEVYENLNGILNVEVNVRQPILRIFNSKGRSVYLDEEGRFMPLSRKYSSRTPIVNGYINSDFSKYIGASIFELPDSLNTPDVLVMADLFKIVQTCRADKFWKAQFNQFYVSEEGEIEMIPRVGDHIILVGNSSSIDQKLNKLQMFYEKGLNKTGWNEYKTINLKYASQVVCTKS